MENYTDIMEDDSEYLMSSVIQQEGQEELELEPNITTVTDTLTRLAGVYASVTNVSILADLDFTSLLKNEGCSDWVGIQHIYYQISNILFLIAFLLPLSGTFTLFFRAFIVSGYFLNLSYGMDITCDFDTILWSCIFIFINAGWFIAAFLNLRFKPLDKKFDSVYRKLFQPLQLSQKQFQMLIDECRTRKILTAKEIYVEEKITRVDSLTLVLTGRFSVSQQGAELHTVTGHQFLDSPEWFGVNTDDYFQVSVTALEDSEVIIWHRDKLKFFLHKHPYIQVVFDHVLGRDVVRKLIQVQGQTVENKPTLINRTLEGDYKSSLLVETKRLGRISENERESLV